MTARSSRLFRYPEPLYGIMVAHRRSKQSGIKESLGRLPLFEDGFLRMQAINLHIVDEFIMRAENDLREQYARTDQTPVATAMFVSALSQLWIFGLYELLRTWRQRSRAVLKFAEELAPLNAKARRKRIAEERSRVRAAAASVPGFEFSHWKPFKRAARSKRYVETLRLAFDGSERLFRKIEALRISLAKHEVPKSRGTLAMAPGYGRIDATNGSIWWEVILRGREVDSVSRRDIADGCRALARSRRSTILSREIQAKVAGLPELGYGIHRIVVTLEDGKEYRDVVVAWSKEVIKVAGYRRLPFNAARIAEVRSAI
jgi:hypothetical protein